MSEKIIRASVAFKLRTTELRFGEGVSRYDFIVTLFGQLQDSSANGAYPTEAAAIKAGRESVARISAYEPPATSTGARAS